MKIHSILYLALIIASGLFVTGCSSQNNESATAPSGGAEATHDEHEHPTSGPHGGDLIELGNEQYHAEILHENQVVVYLLDGAAKTATAIEAGEVTINVAHSGEAEQFRLAADRDAQDPEGKSSRFSSTDAELLSDLRSGDAEFELAVTIDGKQYRGSLEHNHQENGHDY
jgi:hypothetical protein